MFSTAIVPKTTLEHSDIFSSRWMFEWCIEWSRIFNLRWTWARWKFIRLWCTERFACSNRSSASSYQPLSNWKWGFSSNSLIFSWSFFFQSKNGLPKFLNEASLIVHCTHGSATGRSYRGAEQLKEAGFNATMYEGGLMGWKEKFSNNRWKIYIKSYKPEYNM